MTTEHAWNLRTHIESCVLGTNKIYFNLTAHYRVLLKAILHWTKIVFWKTTWRRFIYPSHSLPSSSNNPNVATTSQLFASSFQSTKSRHTSLVSSCGTAIHYIWVHSISLIRLKSQLNLGEISCTNHDLLGRSGGFVLGLPKFYSESNEDTKLDEHQIDGHLDMTRAH